MGTCSEQITKVKIMQNFFEVSKGFGSIKEGQSISIEYLKTPECKDIRQLKPDCGGCTILDNWKDRVIITYTAAKIPPQVLTPSVQFQNIEKGATVDFMDGTTERLYFSGRVTK